jgi:hypothetical protein
MFPPDPTAPPSPLDVPPWPPLPPEPLGDPLPVDVAPVLVAWVLDDVVPATPADPEP